MCLRGVRAWRCRRALLRNLRQLYVQATDWARLLGTSERLLLLSLAEPVSNEAERNACVIDMLRCLCELEWHDRQSEARDLLLRLLRQGEAGGLSPSEQMSIGSLLKMPWFAGELGGLAAPADQPVPGQGPITGPFPVHEAGTAPEGAMPPPPPPPPPQGPLAPWPNLASQ